jgi:hypothetical protein
VDAGAPVAVVGLAVGEAVPVAAVEEEVEEEVAEAPPELAASERVRLTTRFRR